MHPSPRYVFKSKSCAKSCIGKDFNILGAARSSKVYEVAQLRTMMGLNDTLCWVI